MLIVAAGSVSATVGLAAVLLLWLAVVMGAGAAGSCDSASAGASPSGNGVPVELQPIFIRAADAYGLGERGPSVLAALTSIESDFGRNMGPSPAGAVGWTQFLPGTWRRYGIDADGDGRKDPLDADDAIHGTANYLHASGAPEDWHRALFTYNHADWYVNQVLRRAASLFDTGLEGIAATCAASQPASPGKTHRVTVGGDLTEIPGAPGMRVDARILDDVVYLVRTYHLHVSAAYAPTGHKTAGEHPLGLALDLRPGAGGSWNEVDRLARWAEPHPNEPRPPFRWVGYDGDAGHGRGDHLHLSWDHSPTPPGHPPEWVLAFSDDGAPE